MLLGSAIVNYECVIFRWIFGSVCYMTFKYAGWMCKCVSSEMTSVENESLKTI